MCVARKLLWKKIYVNFLVVVFGNPGQPGFPPFYPNFCQKLKFFFNVLRWTIWQLGNQTIVFLSPIYFHFILVFLPSTILYSLSCFPPSSPTSFIFWLTLSSHSPSAFLSWLQDFSAAIICQPFCQKSAANKLCPSRTFFMPWQIIGWQNIFLTNVGQTASNCRVASHEYKFYCRTQTW